MDLKSLKLEGASNGSAEINENDCILKANGDTDWFYHPANQTRRNNVISVCTEIANDIFSITAKVSVDFSSPYDAGAIFVQVDEDNWAKLAFEYSAQKKPTIVSVVTRTVSDDSDGPTFYGPEAWLRVYGEGEALAFHYSEDGKFWNFLRWFSIPGISQRPIKIGLGAQSPTGSGTTARFKDVVISHDAITNLRDGS